tara:strand:+ start:24901 stop:26010 length:1110 start_codon:yes stop_codon:yes gene_type:complete
MPKTLILVFVTSLLINFSNLLAADFKSDGMSLTTEELTQQQDVIWGFDFLNENKIIFTERSGQLKTFNLKDKKVETISGVPKVWSKEQGGLLDVRVHPKIKTKIFLTYSEPVDTDKATTAFASADLDGLTLKNFRKIISAGSPNNIGAHFGSRIEFDDQDHIFVTIGERYDRPKVQDKKTYLGKILRFNLDGTVPEDNPFAKDGSGLKEIWTIGHRSPQGLSWNSAKKQLWQAEMGPKGGDEVNLILKGANYGWPVVTYGTEYEGPKIGEGSEKVGMKSPIVYWVPSISPSGIGFYFGDKIPKWKGNLFVGCLSGSHLRRLVFKGDKVIQQEELLKDMNLRFRNVRTGPDGWIYFSTDQGHIMRIKTKS